MKPEAPETRTVAGMMRMNRVCGDLEDGVMSFREVTFLDVILKRRKLMGNVVLKMPPECAL